jgi:hypothetical protein
MKTKNIIALAVFSLAGAGLLVWPGSVSCGEAQAKQYGNDENVCRFAFTTMQDGEPVAAFYFPKPATERRYLSLPGDYFTLSLGEIDARLEVSRKNPARLHGSAIESQRQLLIARDALKEFIKQKTPLLRPNLHAGIDCSGLRL